MTGGSFPLIVTDGFEYYAKVVRRVFGWACLYAQVLKTRRNDRIVKVERKPLIGAEWRFEDALSESEDSSTLNTSFLNGQLDEIEIFTAALSAGEIQAIFNAGSAGKCNQIPGDCDQDRRAPLICQAISHSG